MGSAPEFRLGSLSWTVKAGVTVSAGMALIPATSGAQEVQLAVGTSNHICGVALADAAAGETVTACFSGIVDVLVDDGESAWAVGDLIKPTTGGLWIKTTSAGAKYWGVAQGTTTGGTGESCKALIFGMAPAMIPAS